MDNGKIIRHFEQRLKAITDAESARGKTSFTFDNPHTCHHCQGVYITVQTENYTSVCQECFWTGDNRVSTDERERICGGCGRLSPNVKTSVYSATGYDLLDAIAASENGCILYMWLLDNLVTIISCRKDWQTDETLRLANYRFHLSAVSFSPFVSFPIRATLAATEPSVTADDANKLTMWRQLSARTIATDPAARLISGRPYEQDVKSAASLQFAQDSLRHCLQNHGRCIPFFNDKVDREQRAIGPKQAIAPETIDIALIPSRLISVGGRQDGSQVRLIEVRNTSDDMKLHVSTAGFVALSYCWGGDQPVTLTKASHEDLKKGFAVSKLPQSLQDAVWVTRKIGMSYLWIDALCIIQDDIQDKAHEIARMATYYGGAKLTLCASAASRSSQGFLNVREPSPFRTGPILLKLRSRDGHQAGNVYLVEEEDEEAEVEPTASRGWTLQESLLSRRILIYAQKQLYWCCVNSFAGCGGEFIRLVDRVAGGPETLVNNIHPLGSFLDLPTDIQWCRIVGQYTRRRLGFAADKLLAVSSLADRLVRLCSERGEDPIYLAGLLVCRKERNSFFSQLMWHSSEDRSQAQRPPSYRSPSWSWAAVDGPIDSGPRIPRNFMEVANRATIKQAHVHLNVSTALFGGVHGGFLELQSKIYPLANLANEPVALRIVSDWSESPFLAKFVVRFEFFPDTEEDRRAIEAATASTATPRPLFLAGLCWMDSWIMLEAEYPMKEGVIGAIGLVIAPSDIDQAAFTRVGVFRVIREKSNKETVDDLRSTNHFDLDVLFSCQKEQSIQIL